MQRVYRLKCDFLSIPSDLLTDVWEGASVTDMGFGCVACIFFAQADWSSLCNGNKHSAGHCSGAEPLHKGITQPRMNT